MAPELQARYPDIRTYVVGGDGGSGRLAVSPRGVSALLFTPVGPVAIDPAAYGSEIHTTYDVRDLDVSADLFDGHDVLGHTAVDAAVQLTRAASGSVGETLRTYRIALAARGEYTEQQGGGTVAEGLASLVGVVTRLNTIYERDLALTFELVADNDRVIYTDPDTDPFSGTKEEVMYQGRDVLDAVIGTDNYDIGHTIGYHEGGGIAGYRVTCTAKKGLGITGLGDQVAVSELVLLPHEIGHQLGAPHTWVQPFENGPLNADGVEPLMGYTIMGYASYADGRATRISRPESERVGLRFHARSIDLIDAFVRRGGGASCGTDTPTGNDVPIVRLPTTAHTIPTGTPFALAGSATDDSGTTLTYTWEQMDLYGDGTGAAPLFRSFAPSSSPDRAFPDLTTAHPDETLPTGSETYTFRLTARDNAPGAGALGWAELTVTTDGSTGPLAVTTGAVVGAVYPVATTVTWSVAGTDAYAPTVDVLFSTDGGATYPYTLAAATANDGSLDVVFPVTTESGRVKVEAVGGIFYAVSPVDFAVTEGALPVASASAASIDVTVDAGLTGEATLALRNEGAEGAPDLVWSAEVVTHSGAVLAADACGDDDVLWIDARPPWSRADYTAGRGEPAQSFVAPCSGLLEHVAPYVLPTHAGTDYSGVLRIYEGEGTGGTELAAVPFEKTVPSVVTYDAVPLPSPLPVTSGRAYTFYFDLTSTGAAVPFGYTRDNLYTDGTAYLTTDGTAASAGPLSGYDFGVEVTFGAPTGAWASVTPVSGTVAPGANGSIAFTVDAGPLGVGVYAADVVLTTNDPDAAEVTIPVTLTAAGDALALADGAGWRVLSVPYDRATVQTLADQNLVQGVTGSYPAAEPNLFVGYDGAAWLGATGLDQPIPLGTGITWYLFDEDIDPDATDPDNGVGVALPGAIDGTGAGSENAADIDVTLHADGDRWNLIGNPFLDTLDVSDLGTWDGAGALNSVVGHVWQCLPNAAVPVECVGSFTLTSDLGDTVPAWHAAFLQASTAGVLKVPASAVSASMAFPRPRIGFELTSTDGGAVDRAAAVTFTAEGSLGWDPHDAEKLTSLAWPAVEVALGGEREGSPMLLAQSSLPDAGDLDVPVYAASYAAGSDLVLSWPRWSGIPEEWEVNLTDLVTGETVDLRETSEIAFSVQESETPVASLRTSGGVSAPIGVRSPRFTLSVGAGRSTSDEWRNGGETRIDDPFPNPSRAGATVPFNLAVSGSARLTVLDLLGREVAVLADGLRPAGMNHASLPTGLAAGVYLVRLETEDTVRTRRAVVVR